MAEKRSKKKGVINEDKTCQLLHRYSATTIITLLQEVSRSVDVKIDWKSLVTTSSTGISNPREYQLLWRHLAYCEPLDQVDGTEPKDDDSDLEFELEAEPAVSAEVSAKAAACVKVLMPSCLPRDIGSTKVPGLEACFSQERCTGQTSGSADKGHGAHSACRKNITHGSVHKQAVTTQSKKRKLWSEEEDTDLISAVQKHADGNWVTIKEEFKHNRSASQLSQRWSILKKKSSNTNTGLANHTSITAPSEAVLATREAVASALKMPMARSTAAIHTGVTQSTTPSKTPKFPSKLSEASHAMVSPPPASNPGQPPVKGTPTSSVKLRAVPETPSTSLKPLVGPNSLIQAAAFAAGGRIVAPSTAATYLKAAQAKNVHIMHGGASLSSANKGRSKPTYPPNRPFLMSPPSGNSFKSPPNGAKVGSTNLLTATELNCDNAQATIEKISGASDRDEELPKKMEMDVAQKDQGQKKAFVVGVNGSSTAKDLDETRSKEEDR